MPKNNTIIHKTHSKKELIHIINIFNIPMAVSPKANKFQIASQLWETISKIDYLYINPHNELMINNLKELRIYLQNQNPKKNLSIKEKENVSFISKKIIHYCNNSYNIEISMYDNLIDIYNDALFISKNGEMPIVRKSLKLLDGDHNKLFDVKPKITPMIMRELELKEKLKTKRKYYECKIRFGKFVINFD